MHAAFDNQDLRARVTQRDTQFGDIYIRHAPTLTCAGNAEEAPQIISIMYVYVRCLLLMHF
jgi:hypothetical protein